MDDYIAIIDGPIKIHLDSPFQLSMEVKLIIEDDFEITFEILGKSLFFIEQNKKHRGFHFETRRKFKFNSNDHKQICNANLVIGGGDSSFPIRTRIKVSTPNSTPAYWKLNIYKHVV